MGSDGLKVFQELHLRSASASAGIREHVLAHVKKPWRHEEDREAAIKGFAGDDADILAFGREAGDGIDEVSLVLWQEPGGYRVANIVPKNVGELGIEGYNGVLQDFVAVVAKPAAAAAGGGFEVVLASSQQTLEDWMDDGPASALRRFSKLANKSTGASHPRDQERWFEFLIAMHRSGRRCDSERVARWLSEVERWPEETARSLACEYEVALGLLDQYDQSKP